MRGTELRLVPKHGDTVRLLRPEAGLAAGAEGTLLGWYAKPDGPMALVLFSDGEARQVPAAALVEVEPPE